MPELPATIAGRQQRDDRAGADLRQLRHEQSPQSACHLIDRFVTHRSVTQPESIEITFLEIQSLAFATVLRRAARWRPADDCSPTLPDCRY